MAHHEDCQLGLAAFRARLVDRPENLAQGAHLGPRKFVAELVEELGVGDWLARRGCGDEMRADFVRVGEPPRVAHLG